MTRLLRRRRRLTSGESGFTLIELSVAMLVVLIVMTSVIAVFVGTLKTVTLAKQRQTATALATQQMEKLRAMNPKTLTAGIYCDDVAGDSNLSLVGTCPNALSVRFSSPVGGVVEYLTVQATPTGARSTTPTYPHRPLTGTTVDGVTYTVASYVTVSSAVADASAADQAVNLTVITSWSSAVSHGTQRVMQRSLAFSPTRCSSAASHPYAGPCQAQFTASAGITNGSISVTNATDTTQTIPGFNGKSVVFGLPGLSTSLANEQVTKLSGSAQTTGATATDSTGVVTNTGGVAASSSSDDDPNSQSTGPSTGSLTQASSPISIAGTAGTLAVTPSDGDTGSTRSQVVGDTNCVDSSGTALTIGGQPCAVGSVQALGTASASWTSSGVVRNFALASLGPSPALARATVARLTASSGSSCASTSGVGCVTAQASRTLGNLTVGGLPTAGTGESVPTGWTGSSVTVSGLAEKALAESGVGGANNPTYTRDASASLTYYNGGSVATVPLNSVTTPIDTTPATGIYKNGTTTLAVTVSSHIVVNPATPVTPMSTGTSPCKDAACTQKASASSSVVITTTYGVTLNGSTLTTFVVLADTGSLLAQSGYTAAFDA